MSAVTSSTVAAGMLVRAFGRTADTFGALGVLLDDRGVSSSFGSGGGGGNVGASDADFFFSAVLPRVEGACDRRGLR